MTTVYTFEELDAIDLYIEILIEQIANVTANFPAGPIKVSILAYLNAELTAYTSLQGVAAAYLTTILGIQSGVIEVQGGVYIGINNSDPARPIINYNGPVPNPVWAKYTLNFADYNPQTGGGAYHTVIAGFTGAILSYYFKVIDPFLDVNGINPSFDLGIGPAANHRFIASHAMTPVTPIQDSNVEGSSTTALQDNQDIQGFINASGALVAGQVELYLQIENFNF